MGPSSGATSYAHLMEFLLDVVFVSIASAFFALAIGYVLLCDRLMK